MLGGTGEARTGASDWPVGPVAGLAMVAFLGATAGIQMSDRGLQAILSPAIKRSFAVGDTTIGAMHGIAGILVASALAVPLARLADRHSRKRILLGLIAGWSLLTGIGALAGTFPLFFLGRASTGVTEFAMIPIVYSMIPDAVAERWRVTANLGFAALMAIGASLGFYLGGNLLDLATRLAEAWPLEPWRIAELMLSVTGVPLLLIGLLLVDPPRGGRMASGTTAADSAPSFAAFLRAHRAAITCFVGTAAGLAIAVQATTPMIAMALTRRFASQLDEVGHALGLATLVASLGSLPLAGALDRALRPRVGKRSRPLIMAASAVLAIPCAAFLGATATQSGALALVAAFLFTTCIANNLIPTMLQDLSPPGLRARAFAVYSFVIAGFFAIGPVLSGLVSDWLADGDLLLSIGMTAVPALIVATLCAVQAARLERGAGQAAGVVLARA